MDKRLHVRLNDWQDVKLTKLEQWTGQTRTAVVMEAIDRMHREEAAKIVRHECECALCGASVGVEIHKLFDLGLEEICTGVVCDDCAKYG